MPLKLFVALILGVAGWAMVNPEKDPAVRPTKEPPFTQSGAATFFGDLVPMGHEWVTRLSALELLGGDAVIEPDPRDPRLKWTKGKAKHTSLDDPGAKREVARIKGQKVKDERYQSTYAPVLEAIIGERWVDIGGFNVAKASRAKCDCFDAVAQEPAAIQQDHFMRRYDDRGAEGGVLAARRSQERFITHFVTASTAPKTLMKVWDGGAYSALDEVDRNFFLFGRAAHLFQDSFSPEHTVRMPEDNYERIRQVKAYLCSAGAEQHSHGNEAVLDYTSGDVIWNIGTRLNVGWESYRPRYMKDVALVATEASKDLWAAFIRTMGSPPADRERAAHEEARALVETWLYFDEEEMLTWYDDERHRDDTYVLSEGQTGKGLSVAECMRGLGVESGSQLERVSELEASQRLCLYNIVAESGYADLFDPYLQMPFNWTWRNQLKWETPPQGWKIPTHVADTGIRVRIKSVQNGQDMSAPDGMANNKLIYCKPGGEALDFIIVGDKSNAYLRLTGASLFLSYRAATGAVKLYSTPDKAAYAFERAGSGWAIRNLHYDQYIWLSGESPYLTKRGKPDHANAQWSIEGLPANW